jgi:hypothetical protein
MRANSDETVFLPTEPTRRPVDAKPSPPQREGMGKEKPDGHGNKIFAILFAPASVRPALAGAVARVYRYVRG